MNKLWLLFRELKVTNKKQYCMKDLSNNILKYSWNSILFIWWFYDKKTGYNNKFENKLMLVFHMFWRLTSVNICYCGSFCLDFIRVNHFHCLSFCFPSVMNWQLHCLIQEPVFCLFNLSVLSGSSFSLFLTSYFWYMIIIHWLLIVLESLLNIHTSIHKYFPYIWGKNTLKSC